MSFTDQKPHIATEVQCKMRWGGAKPGERFRCYLCGVKFKVGDIFRWVFCGDIHLTNFLTCESCDGSNVKDKWKAANTEAAMRFWWVGN